jgi:prephenate dehydratase
MLRVSFQGEPGAFSEEAIIDEFGTSVLSVPIQSLREVFESVGKRKADAAAVHVENSLEGAVNETCDLLLGSELGASGEIKFRIHHSLIGRPGSSLAGGVYEVSVISGGGTFY